MLSDVHILICIGNILHVDSSLPNSFSPGRGEVSAVNDSSLGRGEFPAVNNYSPCHGEDWVKTW